MHTYDHDDVEGGDGLSCVEVFLLEMSIRIRLSCSRIDSSFQRASALAARTFIVSLLCFSWSSSSSVGASGLVNLNQEDHRGSMSRCEYWPIIPWCFTL